MVRTDGAIEARSLRREARPELEVPLTCRKMPLPQPFETVRYCTEFDRADRVATITLNRPDRLNSFNRTMCEDGGLAHRQADEATNAVVPRAAGSRAFSAGLDVKSDYGQPTMCGTTRIRVNCSALNGRRCGSRWWCAPFQGMCTAGALYFVNEADVVICSQEATFFDSRDRRTGVGTRTDRPDAQRSASGTPCEWR